MTINLFFGYMSPTKFNFIVSAAIFASTIYFLWMKFKKNSRVTRKDDLMDGSRKQETDAKNDSVKNQDIMNSDKNENPIIAITDSCKNSDLEKVITQEFEERIRKMISMDKSQTEIIDKSDINFVNFIKSNSNEILTDDFNEEIKNSTIDDSLEILCEKMENININSTINQEILIDEITDVTTDIGKDNDILISGTEEILFERPLKDFQENVEDIYQIDSGKIEKNNQVEEIVKTIPESHTEAGKRNKCMNGKSNDTEEGEVQIADKIYNSEEIYNHKNMDKNMAIEPRQKIEKTITEIQDIEKQVNSQIFVSYYEVEDDKIVNETVINEGFEKNKVNIDLDIDFSVLSDRVENIKVEFPNDMYQSDEVRNMNVGNIEKINDIEGIEEREIVDESFIEERSEKIDSVSSLKTNDILRLEKVEEKSVEEIKEYFSEEILENSGEVLNFVEVEEGEIIDESFIYDNLDNIRNHIVDIDDIKIVKEPTEETIEFCEKDQIINIEKIENFVQDKEREDGEIVDESFVYDNLDNIQKHMVDIKVGVEDIKIVKEPTEETIEFCEKDQIINIEKIENFVQDKEREYGEIVDESFVEKSEKFEENKDTGLNIELLEKVNDLDLHNNNLEDLQVQENTEDLVNNETTEILNEVAKEIVANCLTVIKEQGIMSQVIILDNSEKLDDAERCEEQNKEHKNTYPIIEELIETNGYLEKESEVVNEISEKIHVHNDVDHFLNNEKNEQPFVDYIDNNLDMTTEKVCADLDFCSEILKMEEVGIFVDEYYDEDGEQNSPIKENQFCNLNEFDKDINEDYEKDNQSSKQDIDSSSDSQESDYLHDSPLDGLIAECLNGKESDCNSLSNQVDDTELFGKHENWPNDEDSLNNIKRDFYDMQINICSPNSSSESDHAHCMNNLTERVAILSAESILDGRAQANSSDSEMTATISSTSREDCSPELYVEKITCGGKEVDVVYFDEAVLEEGGVQTDAKIVRTIPVGLGGRIIGKKGKTKNELMKKFGAKLLIYNHPIEIGMQVLEITCKPSISEEMESWVNKTLEQITKTTVQTTVSNPEWLKPMIPLGKMVAAHIIDMSTMEHVKLRIYDPEIIKKFNKMQIEMNTDYGNVDNSALLPRPVAVGCVCVAMIRPDYFLRAQIIEIYDDIVWVYLFDIGKVCQTYLFYLFKIREKYMRVPFQVIPARLPHALLKNNSITSDIIYKRFLLDPITKKPKMVRVFFPRMNSCCVPCANIYIPMSVVDSESKNSEEFVDLLELLVSIDVCTMVRETINSEFQMEINKNHFRNFLNDKQRKQLANTQVPVYFQPCNGKFYEDFIDFQMGNDKNV